MTWNIALTGCGTVGKALLELLHEKREMLKNRFHFEYNISLISARSKGILLNPAGLDLDGVLSALHEKNSLSEFPQSSGSFSELLTESKANILVEATPTNLNTAEPALAHITTALNQNIHVVTVNKGPIALNFNALQALAEAHHVQLRYEGTVMSGTPLIELAKHGLAGAAINRIEGILNGTTNYMLTRMENGASYEEALIEAQELGYAETDPSGDVDGWDAAVKVSILAKALFGVDLPIDQVDRTGISGISSEDIQAADKKGERIRLIATIENHGDGIRGSVKPLSLPLTHPLSQVQGVMNAACLTTDTLGPVTLIGAGAGGRETAQALLADILNIAQKD